MFRGSYKDAYGGNRGTSNSNETTAIGEREEKMDTGNGHFKQLNKEDLQKLLEKNQDRPVDGLFREGEELLIKNSRFRIQSIRPKKMILKLLKRDNH